MTHPVSQLIEFQINIYDQSSIFCKIMNLNKISEKLIILFIS